MALETLRLEHIPPTCQIYTAFFRDVSNCEFLHAQLLSRNSEFEYAFIDASSVISRNHLIAAVYSAANLLLDGTLRTPNVHSEIVVSLNTNNNVRAPTCTGVAITPMSSEAVLTCPRSQTHTEGGGLPRARQKI
jgi:hypothetical protein